MDTTDTSRATVDVNYAPNRDYSLNFYAGVESFEVEQSGFGNLSNSTTEWHYSIEDKSDIFGITVRADNLSGVVDLSVDYRYQKGDGDYKTIDPTNVSGPFPNLDTIINSITINADIFLANKPIINVTYIYEDYDSESWVWKDDFNEPGNTYFGTLNYGYESPTYTTQVFLIGASYQF
ncbi:MAG: MtrB/PioB family outer membrane beta-barrel protein [bacterium]